MDIRTELFAAGTIPESDLTYVVICARNRDRWIFVRHRDRTTWEMPAGHIEKGESPDQAAVRELHEETGALSSALDHIHDYGVTSKGRIAYGRLYAATVYELDSELEHEIEEIRYTDNLPESLTYPEVQTILFRSIMEHFTPLA